MNIKQPAVTAALGGFLVQFLERCVDSTSEAICDSLSPQMTNYRCKNEQVVESTLTV